MTVTPGGKVYVGSVGPLETWTALDWATTEALNDPAPILSGGPQWWTYSFTVEAIDPEVWRLLFGAPVPRFIRHPAMNRKPSVPVKPSAARRGRTHRRKR